MSRRLSLWPGLMLGLLVVAAPAQAARTTLGPFVDFTASGPTDQVIGSGNTSTSINVWYGINPNATSNTPYPIHPPLVTCHNPMPPGGLYCGTMTCSDSISIGLINDPPPSSDLRVIGVSYLSHDTAVPAGEMQATPVYGQNLGNASAGLAITGFDPVKPALVVSDARLFGHSGAVFVPQARSVTALGGLAALLGPSHDLSAFQGDPASVVYGFTTTVPVSELISSLPEPARYALLGGGPGRRVLGRAARRRRAGPAR